MKEKDEGREKSGKWLLERELLDVPVTSLANQMV